MYIILSPSKSQDFSRDFSKEISGVKISEADFSTSEFLPETEKLAKIFKEKKVEDLEKIMKISKNLAELNFGRFQKWNKNFSKRKIESNSEEKNFNFSPAIFAFTGDVYSGFDLENWNKKDFEFAEKHLGILSGFYGLISPLNFIKPYRLEMGTKNFLEIEKEIYKNLYEFWGEKISEKFLEIIKKEKVIVNLASVEYSKVINFKKNNIEKVDVEFKIKKGEKISIIAIYAKKARGKMANWIIKNKINKIEDLKKFSEDGWKFDKENSLERKIIFVKKV